MWSLLSKLRLCCQHLGIGAFGVINFMAFGLLMVSDTQALTADEERPYRDVVAEVLAEDDVDALRELVVTATKQGDWVTVAKAARRWRTLTESLELGIFELSAYVSTDQLEQGLALLKLLLAAEPGPWTGWAKLADILSALPGIAEPRALLALLEQSEEASDQETQILFARAKLLEGVNHHREAFEALEAAAVNELSAVQLEWAMRLARSVGPPTRALALLDKAQVNYQKEGIFAIWRSEILKELDQPEAALETLLNAQQTPIVLSYQGKAALALGRLELAEAAWKETLALVDDAGWTSQEAYYIAHLAKALGYLPEASLWLGRVKEGTLSHEAALEHAFLFTRLVEDESWERSTDALAEIRAALASVRRQADQTKAEQAWLFEAALLRRVHNSQALIDLITQALADDSSNEFLLYLRGIEAMQIGQLDLAEQDFRRLIQLDRSNSEALNSLGYLLADRTTRYREAYWLIEQALILEPNSPEILDSMGWVNYRLGRIDEALAYLEAAYALSDDQEIRDHLVEVLRVAGQMDRAARYVEESQL